MKGIDNAGLINNMERSVVILYICIEYMYGVVNVVDIISIAVVVFIRMWKVKA